eukprot:g16177.t1
MCHTKILFVFFGAKSYGNKCIPKKLLQETIGGLWDGDAREPSNWLLYALERIKTATPTSFKFPQRFTHLEGIVNELKTTSLAKRTNEKNERKIETYKKELDKLAKQLEEKLHKVKLNATKKALNGFIWYEKHFYNVLNTIHRHRSVEEPLVEKLKKCLEEKGVGACPALEERCRSQVGYYRNHYDSLRSKNKFIQKIMGKKQEIYVKLELLKVRLRTKNKFSQMIMDVKQEIRDKLERLKGITGAEAFFKLLARDLCLPKTLSTYAKYHNNKVDQKKGQEVDIVGRISRNVCLGLKRNHNKYNELDCREVLKQTRVVSTSGGRLQSGYDFDYSALWNEFASKLLTNGECAGEILQDVDVNQDGAFQFKCSKAIALCNCIVGVGETGWKAHFFSPEEEGSSIELNVLKDDKTDYVSFEIMENGEHLAYGDVNEGDVEGAIGNGRRRLLSTGSGQKEGV